MKFNIRVFSFFLTISMLFGAAPVLFSQDFDAEAVLNEAVQHLAQRDYAQALAAFDKLPPGEAEKAEVRIMRAGILNAAGKTAEAKLIANDILSKDENNTDAMMVLADAFALENNTRQRRNNLEKVIKINPHHARALNDLGNLALENRNLYVAGTYFDRALAAEPDNGESLVGRATVHRYNREARKGEALLNRAIELYPDWARPYHERARLYKGANFLPDALKDLEQAEKLEPGNYWIVVDRGLVLMDMNRKQDALVAFNRAIEIDPNIFMAYVYSAGINDELGDYESAERDYTRLARLKPDYYFAFEGLGVIKMKNKKWAEARDAFLSAYKQAPKEYTYALLATVCWMRAGRQTDPKQFLAQVIRTVPRESIEFTVFRMYHDLNHDSDAAARIDKEQNIYTKARMAFYLASYYDIRGSQTLANRYYLMVQELDANACIEFKLNEWILAERKMGIRAGQ